MTGSQESQWTQWCLLQLDISCKLPLINTSDIVDCNYLIERIEKISKAFTMNISFPTLGPLALFYLLIILIYSLPLFLPLWPYVIDQKWHQMRGSLENLKLMSSWRLQFTQSSLSGIMQRDSFLYSLFFFYKGTFIWFLPIFESFASQIRG